MERYPLVFTQRRVLPVAIAVAVLGAVVAEASWARIACGVIGALALFAAWLQWRARAALVVDDAGYAVEEYGREKLRVAWSEVARIKADVSEHALYVDVGDPTRNLLVPPRRGYGFRFAEQERLFASILRRVPADKVETVARLDAPKS